MTKTNTILICALLIGIASARVTNLEVMKAWNFFRNHPGHAAAILTEKYINKGLNGVYGDKECYKNAVAALKSIQPVKPLTESVGFDLAATYQARYLLKKNLSHTGPSEARTLKMRIMKFGNPTSDWIATEMGASFNQETLVSANDIILHLIADCNNSNNSNRATIFNQTPNIVNAGVGIAVVGDQTIAILLAGKGISSKPVTNAVLTSMGIEGNADYSGKGQSMPSTSTKTNDAFAHPGKELYPSLTNLNVVDWSKDFLGKNPVDDKSVKCPTWVNPVNAKKDGYFKDWRATDIPCTRGEAPFTNTNNLQRTAPFAKKGKCYHRLSFCAVKDVRQRTYRVWIKDREYVTLEAVDAGAAHKPQHAVLKVFKNDKSVDCPVFVNGPILRKRIIQDWYLNGQSCTVGAGNFDKNGFYSPKAISMDHKCYHRVQFCDKKGRTWVKDSEYKTLAEYNAERQ